MLTFPEQRLADAIRDCGLCHAQRASGHRDYNYPTRGWGEPPPESSQDRVCGAHAEQRAWLLLWRYLTPLQRYQLYYCGSFVVHVPTKVRTSTTRIWLVTAKHSGGLSRIARDAQLGGWEITHQGCVVLSQPAPLGDLLLAQKLWIETRPGAMIRFRTWSNMMGRPESLLSQIPLDYVSPNRWSRTEASIFGADPQRPVILPGTPENEILHRASWIPSGGLPRRSTPTVAMGRPIFYHSLAPFVP